MAPKAAAPAAGKKKRAAPSSEDRAVVAELERLSKTVVHKAERLVASAPAAPVDLVANERRFKPMVDFALYDALKGGQPCNPEGSTTAVAKMLVAHLGRRYGGHLDDMQWRAAFLEKNRAPVWKYRPIADWVYALERFGTTDTAAVKCLERQRVDLERSAQEAENGLELAKLHFRLARAVVALGDFQRGDAILRKSLDVLGPLYVAPKAPDSHHARITLKDYVTV